MHKLNRRKLLGGAAWAVLAAHPSVAQVLMGTGGKVVICDGNVLTIPPTPPPDVIGGGGAGSLLTTQITLTNPAGQATQVNPFFSFGLPIPRGGFPNTGYKLALYNAAGTSKISDLQTDQISNGWKPDNSVNYCVVSGYATSTTLAAGASATFTIKADPGTPPTTPVCTLAQLAANSDIKAVCKIGADTYTVSVNTIRTAYGAPPGGVGYPQGLTYAWKNGPYANEWTFGQYLKRDSDGASHRWLFLKLYVTALSPTGPFIVRGLLENPNSYAANPGATLGPVGAGVISVVDSIDLFDGATLIGAVGGINDTRPGSSSFLPTAVNAARASITVTGQFPLYTPIGFSNTGGALPGGLSTASTATYWAGFNSASELIPCISKDVAGKFAFAYYHLVTPAAGLAVALTSVCISGGAYYACTKAGTSSGQLPSGATFTDTNGVIWTAISAHLTSAGTGTHRLQLKAGTSQKTKCAIMGSDSYPYWSGAGALPKLLIGYDFPYLTQQTKTVPKLDPAVTCTGWIGALSTYTQNLPISDIPLSIENGGEFVVDERVNPFSPSAAASIYLPNDPGFITHIRCISMSFMDRQYYQRDERGLCIVSHNYGPARNGVGAYPNMSPLNPRISTLTGAGSPGGFGPWSGLAVDWYGYGGIYSPDSPETSHLPFPHYWPYVTSGDPLFLDVMMEMASACALDTGTGVQVRSWTSGTQTYTFAGTWGQQGRGTGWQLKMWSQAEWVIPTNHPAKPLFSDIMDDTASQSLAFHRAAISPIGQSTGWTYDVYPQGNGQAVEPWMITYINYFYAWEAWKGNRPGWATWLSTYQNLGWLAIYNSDRGGTEKVIDAQWTRIGTGSASVFPPADADWTISVYSRLANATNGAYTPPNAYPPPATAFIYGIGTQQASTATGYIYINGPLPSSSYAAAARATMVLASAAGLSEYTTVLNRVKALQAAIGAGGVKYVQTTGVGNVNGLMWCAD